ncbi:MAG: c-type cytochrome, partial [Candidatus Brocadiales bacterium]
MPERIDPIENKSFAWLFLLVVSLLVISTLWAVYDEVIGRRPWKHYQHKFLKMADAKSQGDLKAATEALATEEYKKLRQEYDRVVKALEVNPERKKRVAELEKIDKDLAEQIHELQLHRGKYQATVYVMEKTEGADKSKLLHDAQGLEPCIEELSTKMAAMQRRKKELRAELKEMSRERGALEEKLLAYEDRLKGIQRFREALKKEKVEIKQIVNDELGLIDRCHSCHAGVVTKGFEEAPQPLRTHPKVVSLPALAPGLPERGILDVHPIETFGCTPCHRGQGYATTTAQKAHGELEYVLNPLLRGKYNQAGCFKCHDYEIDIPGGEVVSLGRKLFHEYGCIGCHSVGALEREDKTRYIGPTLDEIGNKVYPEWVTSWIDDPKKFRADTKMPRFFLSQEEIKNVASYIWQITQKTSVPVNAPKFETEVVEAGKNRFEKVGCLGCHRIADKGGQFAPNLTNIGEKVRYDYLVSWIADPKKHQPQGRMPSLRLNEEESREIAAYLTTLKTKEPGGEHEDFSDPKKAEAGFALVARYGCFGCHKIKGMEDRGKIGADLSDEGVKPIERFDYALLEHEIMHKIGLENPRDDVAKARIAWLTTKLKDP